MKPVVFGNEMQKSGLPTFEHACVDVPRTNDCALHTAVTIRDEFDPNRFFEPDRRELACTIVSQFVDAACSCVSAGRRISWSVRICGSRNRLVMLRKQGGFAIKPLEARARTYLPGWRSRPDDRDYA